MFRAKRSVFAIAFGPWLSSFSAPDRNLWTKLVNSEYAKQALTKVGNPNVLVNLISRRVRQLNSGGGASSRPLISETAGIGVADIALLEIIHDKMGWDLPQELLPPEPAPKKRKKS
jgi:DNA-directed RNA polymerase subunit omega